MASTKRLRKRRKGAHRLDLGPLKEALRDRRQWCAMATTVNPPGESSHWELELDESGNVTDILVDVVTHPDGQELVCRLDLRGSIEIPALGEEVLVVLPAGRIDFMPTIAALMSSGAVANPAGQGPDVGRILIVKPEVMIHDGDGGASPVATLADLQAHKEHFDNHAHHQWGYPSGVLDTGTVVETSTPTQDNTTRSAGLIPDPAPTPAGTTVLKAK